MLFYQIWAIPLTFATSYSLNLTQTLPFFHTSHEIKTKLEDLKQHCQASIHVESFPITEEDTLDVVRITSDEKAPTSFFLFGEHSRELISAESGLSFIEYLCSAESLSCSNGETSSSFDVVIIPNANPISRQQVEKGNFCLRQNEHGVDLNRNWADHWAAADRNMNEETFPGRKPFSEKETQYLRTLLLNVEPTLFLSVHSGACAYMTPYAFTQAPPPQSRKVVWGQVLNALEAQGPICPHGTAAKVMGYRSPGTSLDYAYDVAKVPFAFGFEIFEPPPSLMRKTRRQEEALLPPEEDRELKDSENTACLQAFNPTNERSYRNTLNLWNRNYACLIATIEKLAIKGVGSSTG